MVPDPVQPKNLSACRTQTTEEAEACFTNQHNLVAKALESHGRKVPESLSRRMPFLNVAIIQLILSMADQFMDI